MKLNTEGPTTNQSDQRSDRTLLSASGELGASVYPSPELRRPPYISPHHIDLVLPHHYTSNEYLDQDQDGNGSTTYPESSQRTNLYGSHYPPHYRIPEVTQFEDASTLHDPISDVDSFVLKMSLRTGQQTPPSVYQYHSGPSDTSSSHQRRIPNRHMRTMRPLVNSDRFRYSSEAQAKERPLLLPQGTDLEETPQFHVAFDVPPLKPPRDPGDGSYSDTETYSPAVVIQTLPQSSIPMRNNSGWSNAPPSGPYVLGHTEPPSGGSPRTISDSPASFNLPKSADHMYPDFATSSSEPSDSIPALKKKKSKMHGCEVCKKMFPRPSGLKTHMNTHNNVKPFPCGFPGCPRTFTVRSNAKRHLRTHGIDPSSASESGSSTYVVDFSTPTVMPSPLSAIHEMSEIPYRVRWMPPSLTTRTNADTLATISDADSDSDVDLHENEANMDWRSALPIPLRPVIPSSCTSDSFNPSEERNSYLDAPLYPYHPAEFRALPGPAVAVVAPWSH